MIAVNGLAYVASLVNCGLQPTPTTTQNVVETPSHRAASDLPKRKTPAKLGSERRGEPLLQPVAQDRVDHSESAVVVAQHAVAYKYVCSVTGSARR